MSVRLPKEAVKFDPEALIRTFSAISAPLAPLIAAYQSGPVPQALMLSGPFGIGKRTLAKLLCLCLFCRDGASAPCGECKACKRLIAQTHPNLHVIRLNAGEKSIKIDQVRDMLSQLKRYPLEQGRRAVLLEDFDHFTHAAQNALLKAIEEPDEATVFILTAVNEKAVLPTILSRCRLQRMPAWPDEMLESLLIERGLPTQTARDLIPLASGSPGAALMRADDEGFWQLKSRADASVSQLKSLSDLPAASELLKDYRQDADQVFDYLESRAHAAFGASLSQADDPQDMLAASRKHREMLESLFTARRLRASNVTWQGNTDQLLLNILEENQSCQW